MQNYKVIYSQDNGQVAIMHPAQCGMSISEIANKDIPAGVPYWIVPEEMIPTDRTFRELWRIDADLAGEPSGYGEMEVTDDRN